MGLIQDVSVLEESKNKFRFSKGGVYISIQVDETDRDNLIDWLETGNSHTPPACLDKLVSAGFVERATDSKILGKEFINRHNRTLRYLAMYETDSNPAIKMLENLYNSSVVVIGNGGVGSWVVQNLLQLGVGEIIGVDSDTVDISNLNRTAIFSPGDIGLKKCDVISKYCRKYFPAQNYIGIDAFMDSPDSVLKIIHNKDFVVSAADQPHGKIREWIRVAADAEKIPLIETYGGGAGPIRSIFATEYETDKVIGRSANYVPEDISRRKRGPSVPAFHPMADSIAISQAIFEELSGCKESILRFSRIQKSRDVSIGTLVSTSKSVDNSRR